jgi:hypothetical protein
VSGLSRLTPYSLCFEKDIFICFCALKTRSNLSKRSVGTFLASFLSPLLLYPPMEQDEEALSGRTNTLATELSEAHLDDPLT